MILAFVAALLALVVGCERGHAASAAVELKNGVFLIAEPSLRDPNFSETVILVTHHSPQGSTGVVINRPTTTLLSRVLPERKELAGRLAVRCVVRGRTG